jgi:hypothetical protein
MRSLPDRHFVTNPRLCPRKKHALLAAILASGKYGHVYLSYRSRLFRVHWPKLEEGLIRRLSLQALFHQESLLAGYNVTRHMSGETFQFPTVNAPFQT